MGKLIEMQNGFLELLKYRERHFTRDLEFLEGFDNEISIKRKKDIEQLLKETRQEIDRITKNINQ